MARPLRGIFRWSGTKDPRWDAWFPLSIKEKEILKFPVCEQCGIAVHYLIVDPAYSEAEIQEDPGFFRDWVLHCTDHGHHHMPSGLLAPGQEPPPRMT